MMDLYRYAEELDRLGQTQALLAEYGDLIDAHLGGAEPLLRRSGVLQRLGRLSEARADLAAAAEIDGFHGWAQLSLARMARDLGRPLLAATYVQQALQRQPEMAEMCVNAAAIYSSLGWLDRAFHVVRPLPDDLPDWWGGIRRDAETAYRDLHGRTLRTLQRRRQAAYDKEALVSLCSDLFRIGRLRAAHRLCEVLMRADPTAFMMFEVYAGIVARESGPSEAAGFLRAVAFLHGEKPEHGRALQWMESQTAF